MAHAKIVSVAEEAYGILLEVLFSQVLRIADALLLLDRSFLRDSQNYDSGNHMLLIPADLKKAQEPLPRVDAYSDSGKVVYACDKCFCKQYLFLRNQNPLFEDVCGSR